MLVPNPAVEEDFFYYLNQEQEPIPYKKAIKWMTKKGAKTHGKVLLGDWSEVPGIDLYVVGSVVVSHDGTRLGKVSVRLARNMKLPLRFLEYQINDTSSVIYAGILEGKFVTSVLCC